MNNIVVKLHGGPWHGRNVTIPDDRNHFHIVGEPSLPAEISDTEDEIKQVEVRTGMYSRVTRCPTDFEWDGWVTHA